jgi:hypothetical protein
MERTLFCRRCGAGEPVVAGDVPRICPHCSTEAGWTTMAPAPSIASSSARITLTRDDRIFLKVNRIAAD